jgi:hypothetical protein
MTILYILLAVISLGIAIAGFINATDDWWLYTIASVTFANSANINFLREELGK